MASKKKTTAAVVVLVIGALLLLWWCGRPAEDEAMAAGLTAKDFHQAEDEADYFKGMDDSGEYKQSEVRGRNTWLVWGGGDEAFWDWLANNSFGTFDLLKTLSSYPCSPDQQRRAAEYEKKYQAAWEAEGFGDTYGSSTYGSPGYGSTPAGGYGQPGYGEPGYGQAGAQPAANSSPAAGGDYASTPGDDQSGGDGGNAQPGYVQPGAQPAGNYSPAGGYGQAGGGYGQPGAQPAGNYSPAGGYGQAGGGYSDGNSYYPWDGVCKDKIWPAPGKPAYRYYNRDTRFCYQGLINEPYFAKPQAPDEFGLCLDRRMPGTPPDPFVQYSATDRKGPYKGYKRMMYGYPSGIMSLRLFPNPEFKGKAKERWMEAMKSDRFYLDPSFYSDRKLIRPYRVGMACAFCHVAPHPMRPPADPENPQMSNLSASIGAQYFWFSRVFGANVTYDNFVWHLLDAQRPGTVDTSFIPSDNLVNSRPVNAIFHLGARLEIGKALALERAAGGSLRLPEVKKYKDQDYVFGVPHVLWDGGDSVGIDAALTRVYINIGEYHQEWIRHIGVITGFGKQSPITVKSAQARSTYWNSTQQRTADLASYLVRASLPMPLTLARGPGQPAAPQGPQAQTAAARAAHIAAPDRGKVVFAETCARCHSSKLPRQPKPKKGPMLGDKDCIGDKYLECWNNYWNWTGTAAFKREMTLMVRDPNFTVNNYMSNDVRVPVTYTKTEICSSMASNGIAGHVWSDFSSQSYKELPSVGPINLKEPVTGQVTQWPTPGGGRGYIRPPSLVSVWATAPFLHNNELGQFSGDPSVQGRLKLFDNSIRQMLWPGSRQPYYHKTTAKTDVKVVDTAVPWILRAGARLIGLSHDGTIRLGPVPKGTPVNLIGNLNAGFNDPAASPLKLASNLLGVARDLGQIRKKHMPDDQATAVLTQQIPSLLEISACPDFIVNRGHEFGSELSDPDKEALIAYLKAL